MAMDEQGSITRWLGGLKQGDEKAARALWERYFERMVRLARGKLRTSRRSDAAADEEDAALSAFDSFCFGAARGRFPDLTDRDSLWRLLIVITFRKVNAHARLSYRAKRGSGKVLNASELPGNGDTDEIEALAQVMGSEQTPDSAAAMAEAYQRLLDSLGDDTLRSIAVWKMEGHTSEEIAERLGCALRTVARQLALIRTIWRDASSAED